MKSSPLEGEVAVFNELANVKTAGERYNNKLAPILTTSHKRYSIFCSAESHKGRNVISYISTVKTSPAFVARFARTTAPSPNLGEGWGEVKKYAFTLAEVLITLAIIGVVAAMTMPTLIAKHQEKELAVRIRKVYSDMNNALKLSQVEYDGTIDYSTVFTPGNTHLQSTREFAKYFNGAKVCGLNFPGCDKYFYELRYSQYYTAGKGKGSLYKLNNPCIILNNGAVLYIEQSSYQNCYAETSWHQADKEGNLLYNEDGTPVISHGKSTACAYIHIDVNGPKLPNRYGQDAFRLKVERTKLINGSQKFQGYDSLNNVLSGIDKFIYTDYKVGE